MKRNLLTAVAMASFVCVSALAADFPTRYAPPPVFSGGPGTKVGVLNCTLGPHLGLIVGGFERMDCRFTPEGPGPIEAYSGTMATLGVDLGFTAGGSLTWGVYAPTNQMFPGSLAGSYVGASGNVGVGVGVGENFLIGGSGNRWRCSPGRSRAPRASTFRSALPIWNCGRCEASSPRHFEVAVRVAEHAAR